MKKLIVLIGFVLIFTVGCSGSTTDDNGGTSSAEKNSKSVTLRVTRDFGRETLFNEKVDLKEDWAVYDVLNHNVQLATAHGGGYVKSINGIEGKMGGLGGERKAWMYYVNGILSEEGVLDFYPRAEDVIWWDYHGWQRMSMFPAVIGSYPEPFIHGYKGEVKPTTILFSQKYRASAEKLQKALQEQGASSVNAGQLNSQQLKKPAGPTIVLGDWEQLSKYQHLADLNKSKKNGLSVHFTGSGVGLLDAEGNAARTVEENTGVITATGQGLGDDTSLWLVAGIDEKGLQQAVDVLVNNPEKISGMYNAAIVNGKVVRLPLD